jgi:hypothetical protein
MNTHFGVTDPPLLRFLIHAAQFSRGACLVSKGGQPSDARLGTTQITVLLEMADALGSGSFGDVSSHEMTRLPSSMTSRRGCDRCNRSRHARRRSSHVERRRLDFVPSVRVMHRRVLCRRGVPLRGPDIHGLAGRSFLLPSLFSPGGAPGFFCPSQVCSRGWVDWHFCLSGPTCRFDAARPPRLIFVGVTDRLVGMQFVRAAKGGRPGT